jgi:hypothetical protein
MWGEPMPRQAADNRAVLRQFTYWMWKTKSRKQAKVAGARRGQISLSRRAILHPAVSSSSFDVNLKIAAPEFGPYAIYCRLVKLEQPAEDGATHMILWEPRDR